MSTHFVVGCNWSAITDTLLEDLEDMKVTEWGITSYLDCSYYFGYMVYTCTVVSCKVLQPALQLHGQFLCEDVVIQLHKLQICHLCKSHWLETGVMSSTFTEVKGQIMSNVLLLLCIISLTCLLCNFRVPTHPANGPWKFQ